MAKHKLNVMAAVLTTALVACGGGSPGIVGNIPEPTVAPVIRDYIEIGSVITAHAPLLNFVTARLDQHGNTYVVAAGLLYSHSPPSNFAAPVKIWQINSDGTGQDATTKILGGPVTAATPFPLIADFNGDGIDDIFLAGTLDHSGNAPGSVYVSRAGQTHQRMDLLDQVWSHDVVAVDIDHDGDIDVVNSHGQMWLNNGQGVFSFRDHSWNINYGTGHWMHGSGVCAGDFNRTGRTQLVITDLSQDSYQSPKADSVIYELDTALQPIREHVLPMPTLDRNTTREISHDVTCMVADINRDTWPDILIFSRPWDLSNPNNWTDQGQVQVLLNRGNWQFDDVSATALPGYRYEQAVSYLPIAQDFNGDGLVDLWLSAADHTSGQATSVWINTGKSAFKPVLIDHITAARANGGMMPVLTAQGLRLVFARRQNNTVTLYSTTAVHQIN